MGLTWLLYVLSNLQKAVLAAQLESVEEITSKRKALWFAYLEAFSCMESLGLFELPQIEVGADLNGHIFYVILRSGISREAVIDALAAKGIEVTSHYEPLHLSPAGKEYGRLGGKLEVTERISHQLLRFPLWPEMELKDIDRIADASKRVLSKFALGRRYGCDQLASESRIAYEVKIPVACDLQTINRMLDSGVLNALSSRDLEDVEVSNFNYSQLALLISCFRHGTAKEKADAMRFLRRILTSYRANGSREAGLALENLLYSSYLKYCENEQDYHRFYSSVASSYPSQTVRVRLKGKNLGFFVHSPHLLAHVTPILELLKSRLSSEMDEPAVVIFTLGTNPQFEKAFLELGAVVVDLKLESFTSLPRELIRNCQANDVGNLVWQCLPTFLSYAVSKIEGIHWWSLKYHPNIDGVSKYITNSQYNKKITFNGRKWQRFVPPVGLKNIDAAPMTWESRALTFGAFCRERN